MSKRVLALAATLGFILGLFVHIDLGTAGAWGFDVGTDTHYCSAEIVRWHPSLTCEVAN